jgi:catechol 2,3-dioxygenase-like lactoylglutathione lyase family enzyme
VSAGALHHVGLTVSDLDRSIRFYRDLLGLSVRERDEVTGGQLAIVTGVPGSDVRIADLEFGNGRTLELTQYLAPAGNAVHPRPFDAGHIHVGIDVDDIDVVVTRLVDAGVVLRSQPIALVDAGPYWTGAKVVHAVDPDGITVELVQMPK